MSLQDERHPHVWNAGFVELSTFPLEAELLVERHGLHLRVQVGFAEAESARLFEQAAEDQGADAGAALAGQYRDAADLTGGIQAPGANWVTVQAREHVNAVRILAIPLVRLGYPLFFDEDGAPDPLDRATFRGPGGGHTF